MSWIHRAATLCAASIFAAGAASAQALAPQSHTSSSQPARIAAVDTAVDDVLATDLDRIIRSPGWSDAKFGVLVVSRDRGDTLFAMNPDLPLAPASNMKLFTTAAALYYLGPEFRYTTYLLADGPIRGGVLEGDLVLVGTGDPSISGRLLDGVREMFDSLADSLTALGIREVQGRIIGDGTYFDAETIGPGWKEADLSKWYAAPIGALTIAENMVMIRVMPGQSVGDTAQIHTDPSAEGLSIINRVETVGSGSTRIQINRIGNSLVVEGRIRTNHSGLMRTVPVVDPANFAAAALHRVLLDRGILVTGETRTRREVEARVSGAATAEQTGPQQIGVAASHTSGLRVLAAHLSPPLTEILAVTNQISHNLFAEALLKTIGRVVYGDGSFEAGARAVTEFLAREGIAEPHELQQVDGSGLSRYNRATARATIQLLDYMAESEMADEYLASLPVAAADDARSLRTRMRRTAAAGNLRAKTGTILNVSALSGYVEAANGEQIIFSIIANQVPVSWRAKRLEDAIGARLADFRRPTPSIAASVN